MGLDIDEQYCNLAKNRLSIELNLLKMGKQNYAEDFTKRVS
jgi:DNA modification methylase